MNSFYSKEELQELGLKKYGENVFISRKCSIYDAGKISIGNSVRIDDFCFLSGNIKIGNYVHIATYSGLFGGDAGIEFKDFSGCASKCSIYAITDDYAGNGMTNPMVPEKYKKITRSKVVIEKHALIGTGSVVLPNVTISEGTSIGALSLVNKTTKPWMLYTGNPARPVFEKNKDIVLKLEKKFLEENANA